MQSGEQNLLKRKHTVRSVKGSKASEAESSPQQRTMHIGGLNSHAYGLHQTKGQTSIAQAMAKVEYSDLVRWHRQEMAVTVTYQVVTSL